MAISGLASKSRWVQLASSSPTSGSAVSFTSLASFNRFRVILKDINITAAGDLSMTLNNNASNYSQAVNYFNDSQFKTYTGGGRSLSSISVDPGWTANNPSYPFSGEIIVNYANESTAKTIRYSGAGTSATSAYVDAFGLWDNTSVVDRIDLSLDTGTFSSGSIVVYGSN